MARSSPSLGGILMVDVVEVDVDNIVPLVGDLLGDEIGERGLAYAWVAKEAGALVLEPDVAPK